MIVALKDLGIHDIVTDTGRVAAVYRDSKQALLNVDSIHIDSMAFVEREYIVLVQSSKGRKQMRWNGWKDHSS